MTTPPPPKLDALDGLRGLAILLVVLFHHRQAAEYHAVHTWAYRLLAPTRFGNCGVHLFLVLSGFCLTHSLLRRHAQGRPPSLRDYLVARWWRIAPPYYAAMALVTVFVLVLFAAVGEAIPEGRRIDARQVVYHLGFVHGLRTNTFDAISGPFWSLSLEFQFYLVLPLAFALGQRLGFVPLLAGALAVSLAWRAWVDASLGLPGHYLMHGFFPGRWAEFLAGAAVASWINSPNRRPASRGLVVSLVMVGLGSLVAAVALAARGHVLTLDPTFGAGFAALLAATLLSAESGGSLGRWASVPLLARVGTISYSLYLTHMIPVEILGRLYTQAVPSPTAATELGWLLAMLVAVLAIGWAFHVAVERRFLRSVDTRPAATLKPGAKLDPRLAPA